MSQNGGPSSPQPQPCKGVALVTGASRGIGRGIALRLADDGYDIAANGQTNTVELGMVVETIENKGRRALAIPGDVSEEGVVRDMVKRTVSTLGSLDVMVANAGIAIFESLKETKVESFDRQMAVNVRGTMLCYKFAAEEMVKGKHGGRIIGACSLAGKQGLRDLPGYSATKFAIRGLTQSAAGELGEHHITVNAYAAGAVNTRLLGDYLASVSMDPNAGSKRLLKTAAIERMGKPEEIAHLVSFLASKEACFITGERASLQSRDHMTYAIMKKGQTITIDGGIYFD